MNKKGIDLVATLDILGADANKTSMINFTPLLSAATRGHSSIVKLLLDSGNTLVNLGFVSQ